jgi:hypothetical protein
METKALTPDLAANLETLKGLLSGSVDIVFHSLTIGGSLRGELIYVENMCDLLRVERGILTPLQQISRAEALTPGFLDTHLPVGKVTRVKTEEEVVQSVLSGNPVLLVDERSDALQFGLAAWSQRAIEQPAAENVVRGPLEAFTETMTTNLSILRRRLRSPHLKTKTVETGLLAQTSLTVTYMQNLASPELLAEVMRRLEAIRYEQILESGMLEELIQDNPYSPFPQLLTTERPDVVTSQLLEGRVAIFTEGTPFVLIAPGNFFSFMQSPEDYDNPIKGTIFRILRYFFLLVALLMPAAYVSIVTFHQEMIPTFLLLTIANTREQVPFPALVEALLMELMFEALREAGLRLPKQIGSAISIVGALVIGQAAISAGLVSPPMVMVVAITGIASFMVPHYAISIPLRLLRFPIMIVSGMFGLIGFVLGFISVLIHMTSLNSFGVPYFSLQRPAEMEDTLLRMPSRALYTRTFLSSRAQKKPSFIRSSRKKGS